MAVVPPLDLTFIMFESILVKPSAPESFKLSLTTLSSSSRNNFELIMASTRFRLSISRMSKT